MNNKSLKITDIKIGDILQDKNNQFPMRVVGIFHDGDIFLDFDGNEGSYWEANIKDLEREE